LAAVGKLCAALLRRFGLTREAIVGHRDVARPTGRKVDPVDFPWDNLDEVLRVPTPPRPPEIPKVEYDGQQYHGRVLGDGVLCLPADVFAALLGQVLDEEIRSIQGVGFIPVRAALSRLGLQGRWDSRTQTFKVLVEG
jgi:hypothetical protein